MIFLFFVFLKQRLEVNSRKERKGLGIQEKGEREGKKMEKTGKRMWAHRKEEGDKGGLEEGGGEWERKRERDIVIEREKWNWNGG